MAAAPRKLYKLKSFSRAAKKHGVSDQDLCDAAAELDESKGEDLGGGVWKKRLLKNQSRGIVLTRREAGWLFAEWYDKADQVGLAPDELALYRKAVKDIDQLTREQVAKLLKDKWWIEVTCG